MTTVDIRVGDCRTLLTAMEPQSVHCIVTSPPYFGLRDYGVDGQIGLEQTPDEYVAEMVAVFREVRRVLLMRLLKAAGLPKVALPEATVSITKKAAGVEIVDEDALPDMACKVVRVPDKTRIKELLGEGPVAGARMGEPGETITVRAA